MIFVRVFFFKRYDKTALQLFYVLIFSAGFLVDFFGGVSFFLQIDEF